MTIVHVLFSENVPAEEESEKEVVIMMIIKGCSVVWCGVVWCGYLFTDSSHHCTKEGGREREGD